MVRFIFIVFSVLLWDSAVCIFFNNKGDMEPQNDVYLSVGATLVLNCTLTLYAEKLGSEAMYFMFKPENRSEKSRVSDQFVTVINNKKKNLRIINASVADSGWYYCFMNETSIGKRDDRSIAQKSVLVTEPPRQIEHVNCTSPNFESMTCDWCANPQPGVRYELHWRIGQNVANGSCQLPGHKELGTCSCTFCNSKDAVCLEPDFFHRVEYDLEIKSFKAGHEPLISHLKISTDFESIVIPNPPVNVSITAAPRSISLFWSPPPGLDEPEFFPLDYIVTAQSKGHHTVEAVSRDFSTSLRDLFAYTDYTITVRATPTNGSGLMSAPVTLIAQTLEDVPSSGPLFLPGAFRRVDQRNIVIFWGLIPQTAVNGKLKHFVVKLMNLDNADAALTTVTVPANQYSEKIHINSNTRHIVSVAGVTSPGTGATSYIIIPSAKQSEDYMPIHVDAEITEDKTSVVFTVRPVEGMAVNNYTLLYCMAGVKYGQLDAQKCKDWTTAEMLIYPGNNNTIVFNDHKYDNVYALSANYLDYSSGLSEQWLCTYDYLGDPGNPALDLGPNQIERSLKLQWPPLKCSSSVRGRVQYYQLTVTHGQELVYSNKIPTESHLNDNLMELVPGLNPYTQYNVTLSACTLRTCSSGTNRLFYTIQSAPESPPENITIIVNRTHALTSWQSPSQPNGLISHYQLIFTNVADAADSHTVMTVDNDTSLALSVLAGYQNYSLEVQGINEAGPSPWSNINYVFMPVRAPDAVKFYATVIEGEMIEIKSIDWPKGNHRNGPNPRFTLTLTQDKVSRNYSILDLPIDIKVDNYCSDQELQVNLSVAAYNVIDGEPLYGPWTNNVGLEICQTHTGNVDLKTTITLSVLVPVTGIIIIAVLIYIMTKRRYSDVMNIEIPDFVDAELDPMINGAASSSNAYQTVCSVSDGEDKDSGTYTRENSPTSSVSNGGPFSDAEEQSDQEETVFSGEISNSRNKSHITDYTKATGRLDQMNNTHKFNDDITKTGSSTSYPMDNTDLTSGTSDCDIVVNSNNTCARRSSTCDSGGHFNNICGIIVRDIEMDDSQSEQTISDVCDDETYCHANEFDLPMQFTAVEKRDIKDHRENGNT